MTASAESATHAPRSVAELAALVRAARDGGRGLRILGAGTWSGPGSPAARVRRDAEAVTLRGVTGVVAYVPGDLTLTARAGTTLVELDEATRPFGQWCPLLPWGDDAGTLGATVATATTGPFGAALGRPRDLALGVEFVDGEGTVARGGGRVVKNVAGFDLTRLMVGAFGTLGIVTEVTVRLRARPAADVTLLVTPPGAASVRDGEAAAAALAAADVPPIGCVVLSARDAATFGAAAGGVVARYVGNAAFVRAGREAAARVGAVRDADPAFWTAHRARDPRPRSLSTDPFATSVARRLKERFDPAGVLNPGIFGEGAP